MYPRTRSIIGLAVLLVFLLPHASAAPCLSDSSNTAITKLENQTGADLSDAFTTLCTRDTVIRDQVKDMVDQELQETEEHTNKTVEDAVNRITANIDNMVDQRVDARMDKFATALNRLATVNNRSYSQAERIQALKQENQRLRDQVRNLSSQISTVRNKYVTEDELLEAQENTESDVKKWAQDEAYFNRDTGFFPTVGAIALNPSRGLLFVLVVLGVVAIVAYRFRFEILDRIRNPPGARDSEDAEPIDSDEADELADALNGGGEDEDDA